MFSNGLQAQVKKFILCPGEAKLFTVLAMAGKTYQWQVLTAQSHGFVNLENSANITGVASNSLQITQAETNLYGSAYRCLVSDAQGLIIPDTNYIEFATTWTGTANNNWNNAANWSCGAIPDSSTDVIIETGTPVVNANARCRSLDVKNGASIQVASGIALDITNKKGEDAVLNSEVRIIDSLLFDLNTDTALLNQGVYEFTYTHTNPAFAINDIIVGEQANGFARKVTGISSQGQKVLLQTTQASLADIFKDADYSMKINTDSANGSEGLIGQKSGMGVNGAESGYSFDLSGTTLYSLPGETITITSGTIKVDGDWDIDFKYKDKKVKRFSFACKKLTFNTDLSINVNLNEAGVLPTRTVPVDLFKKKLWFYVPVLGPIGVPVFFELAIDTKAAVGGIVFNATNTDVNIISNNSLSLGIQYENDKWITINESNSETTVSADNASLTAGASIKTSIGAGLSFRLYGILGPYAEMSAVAEGEANVKQEGSFLWDFTTKAYIEYKWGVNAEILVKNFEEEVIDWSESRTSDETIFTTPFEMENLTTGNLSAKPNTYIEEPIKVAVLDNLGNPQANVSVHFKVKEGKGTVDDAVVITDADGLASTKWKLGPKTDTSSVIEVYATTGKGAHIVGSPYIFKAGVLKAPVVSTTIATTITAKTVVTGGEVTSDGGTPVIARGVCWNTTGNPTVISAKTLNGTGLGVFTSNISGLSPKTNYFLRAYAINSTDTAYGNEITFKTDSITDLTGSWSLVSFNNGVLPGEFVNEYSASCPSIITYKWTLVYDNYSIDSTHFSNSTNERVINLGVSYNSSCQVIGDGADTDNSYPENYSGTYTVSGNTIIYTINGVERTYSFAFLGPNLIKVATNVYSRN